MRNPFPIFVLAGLLAGMAGVAGPLAAESGSAAAAAMDQETLAGILDRRIRGDASGACLAAAVIQDGHVARAWRCADPGDAGRIGPEVAFEIGSVSKTMTGILLADLILRGEVSLDDPLADHLPVGSSVPEFAGEPIRLRHLVTHTSGLPRLPPRLQVADPRDPYAGLGPDALLASLEDVTLAQAPGERFVYSNFGAMLLSLLLSRKAGMDFEALLEQRLFRPLGMTHAHVARPPAGVRLAAGHLPDGRPTPPWTFAPELSGVGGVRATLQDMVRYLQAQLDGPAGDTGAAIRLAQQPIATAAAQPMAMGWLLLPLGGRQVHAHDGGTGGFSSMLAFDRERRRAVVVLADTSLAGRGGVDDVAGHLLDSRIPLRQPRTAGALPPPPVPLPSPALLHSDGGTGRLLPAPVQFVHGDGRPWQARAGGRDGFSGRAPVPDLAGAPARGTFLSFHGPGAMMVPSLRTPGRALAGRGGTAGGTPVRPR